MVVCAPAELDAAIEITSTAANKKRFFIAKSSLGTLEIKGIARLSVDHRQLSRPG